MRSILAAVRIGLLDMRSDMRRFILIIACLAVGTALIAGVSSVGASIRQAVERDAAVLMGGDVELSRGDRAATSDELALLARFGQVSNVIDTNVRAESPSGEAFVDLISIGPTYPLLGRIDSAELPADASPHDVLSRRDGVPGALVAPLLLDQLGAKVGDVITVGGSEFEVRGVLRGVPDAAVRGFRLGLPVVITIDGLAALADRTSPLPGLGTWFRYKLKLDSLDSEAGKAAIEAAIADPSWTIRSARDGLGPMVRYYDLFMRFLVIVGLASLLIGGVSVWTGISAYVTERSGVIAVMRSMGAGRSRIFIHFFSQVATLAAMGVGLGLLIGAGIALLALPIVGQAVGVNLPASLHAAPLLVATGVGLLTAFAFSYLPLQQAQAISPVTLFRSKGLAAMPIDWRALLGSLQVLPLLIAAAGIGWLAVIMTGDPTLVLAFAAVSILAVALFQVVLILAGALLTRLPAPQNHTIRHALRDMSGAGSTAPSVVISVGLALAMLVVVLTLEVNLRNEYLGASVFDAPTLVASDLFDDEAETLTQLQQQEGGDVARFTATPMLRATLTAIDGQPVAQVRTRGPEASFLLSGEVPVTYRPLLPASSRLVAGEWWPEDYQGPPLVSLHQSLRSGLGVDIGSTLTFSIFGDDITAEVASFRDYSWQGGIDFLATFSPGVLEAYPATLLGAVTAAPGREDAVERDLATRLPDVRFIAIGETLKQITAALGQLSLAASLVGGLAVGNGLLVLIGSLAAGRRQRQADAVITKVLGARRVSVLRTSALHFLLLAALAALLATPLGLVLSWILTLVLLDVEFAIDATTLAVVILGAIGFTGFLGATTILRALSRRPALLLRQMGTD